MPNQHSKPTGQQKRYQQNDAHGASSKFGQMIGEAFDTQVFALIQKHLQEAHPDHILLTPAEGKKMVKLEMFGGTSRQMDNIIVLEGSNEPVALFESKWLKDGRHHNDKGAWILQLREVSKNYPTVRGAVACLAGYWTEGVAVMFEQEGRIQMVHVATDEEVYGTLQPHVDEFCKRHALPVLQLDAREIRNSLPRSWDLANCLIELADNDQLRDLAESWLRFARRTTDDGQPQLGSDLIREAIDKLLDPLPEVPSVEKFEITLQIDTGNIIYAEFADFEEATAFIQMYHRNPQAILDKIKPKKSPPPEQSAPDSSD
ncbi:MAG: hypothetical protein GYB67_09675 [Chloroflexi bacterium]|nr:hypothetical protein [Chloroflexota bacterium]